MFFILLFSGISCNAQTYIQGKHAKPFDMIGSAPALQNSTLLSIEQAYNKIAPLFYHSTYDYYSKVENYNGQYFLKNDLTINIISQIFPSASSTRYKMLYNMRNSFDPDFDLFKKQNKYFSEIKKIKDYYVFINYMTDDNFAKKACVIDEQGKYMVFVNVFSKNDATSIDQAITMLHSIVNDITFN